MITKIITEFKKHFSADGVHRSRLIQLKSLRKRYPNSPILKFAIHIMRKKMWLFPGADFINNALFSLMEINDAGLLTINGITFNLKDPVAKKIFLLEYAEIFSTDDNFRIHHSSNLLLDEIMAIMLAEEGPYQYDAVSLNKGDVVIDAGSNMGMFALFAAKYNQCKVYAFEPYPAVISLLSKNITNNNLDEKIKVVPLGLSNTICDVKFKIFSQDIWGASFVLNRKSKHAKWEEITIQCVSLDKWVKENQITKIDFIKADIEGAERLLLQGATEVLKTMQPKISICTYHLPDDPEVLEKIILDANPNYTVIQEEKKLFAYVKA